MKLFLASAARKLTYVIAVLLVLAAIGLTISRLTAPMFDKHKADFEVWASQLLNAPVTFGNLKATWFHYAPQVNLENVQILDRETKAPNLEIKEVRVYFSIIKSLWYFKPIPSKILIKGTDVNVKQSETGEYTVQGFPAFGGFSNAPFQAETKISEILQRLSVQPHIILQDIDLRFTDSHGEKRYITFYNLSLANYSKVHTVSGKAILHQEIPTEVTTVVSWLGDEVSLDKMNAKIYLYVSGLSLPQWFQKRTWNNWEIKEGIASAKIWLAWQAGAFREIQTTFQFYDLNLYSALDKTEHKVNRLSGHIGWKKPIDSDTQIFAGDDILIDLPAHLWPVTNFYVALKQDGKGTLTPKIINVGYLDIKDTQAFLFSSSYLSDSQKQLLSDFKPSGALQETQIQFNGNDAEKNKLSFNADFRNVSVIAARKLPAVKNLSGSFKWDGAVGNLTLRSNRVEIEDNAIFAHPISIDQLSAEAILNNKNNVWDLNVTSLQLLTDDTAANLAGRVIIPADASAPTVDLAANFTLEKANRINRYLPVRIFDAALVEWLNQAFLSGEITSANAIIKGKLSDFPFDQNNGMFLVTGNVKNIDLRYAPDWPIIQGINGKIVFAGKGLTIDVSKGYINKLPLTNVHGVIADLTGAKPSILTISGDEIKADFQRGLAFVHASLLEKTIGKMFDDITIQGPMTLKLGLTVPLNKPDDTSVQGQINFTDTSMQLIPWHLTINNLQGDLSFTEKSTNAEKINGELFNKPVQLNVNTIEKDKNNSIIQVNFASDLFISDLENWLKMPFSKVVKGNALVNGKINLALNAPMEIELKSKLAGVAVDLPDDYAKKAEESKDFTALIIAQENQPLRMKLDYGDLFNAALILNHEQNQFALSAAHLRLGKGEASWPEDKGLYISGQFNELRWDKIKQYAAQSDKSNLSTLPPIKNINITTKNLYLNNIKFEDVNLNVTPIRDDWDIQISSPDIEGRIQTPANFNTKGILNAQFQRLNLHSIDSTNKSSIPTIDVTTLPAISIVANNVSYDDMRFGQISFQAMPVRNGLDIQSLQISSSLLNLQSSGTWLRGNVTRLIGKAASPKVSDLLISFGFDAKSFIAQNGKLSFDLTWPGSPYAPSIANLSGSATLDIGKGRIVDIGQSGAKMDFGKMLSIFSLQSIPRRLTFDFSDLFQKGYSFDYVRGDFTFKNGDAYTKNFRFDGPVARVNIDGRIGLKQKDFDFNLSVTPYVTSSLPVAAALLTGPVGGVAALAVNTVIGSNVITYHYVVRGPWDNPTWVNIGKQKQAGDAKAKNENE